MTVLERLRLFACAIVTAAATVLWYAGVDGRGMVGVFLVLLTISFVVSELERARQRRRR